MRLLAALALVILSGCADAGLRTYHVDDVAMPTTPGGPFGGDGTVHVIAAVLSFTVDGETYGDIGAHCATDGWTGTPATARVHAQPDEEPPERVVMRMLSPGQDTSDVSHFGSATYADWRHDGTIQAAFDSERTRGTITWDPPRFSGLPIPQDRWLAVEEHYRTPEGVHVIETLSLRDFSDVPVSFDREDRMCF